VSYVSGIKDNEKYLNKKGVAYRKVMNKTSMCVI